MGRLFQRSTSCTPKKFSLPTTQGLLDFTVLDIRPTWNYTDLTYFPADHIRFTHDYLNLPSFGAIYPQEKPFDGVVMMFDVQCRQSYSHIRNWQKIIRQKCRKIPAVIKRQQTKKFLKYGEISVKAEYCIAQPFIRLVRTFLTDKSLSRLVFRALPRVLIPGRDAAGIEHHFIIARLSQNPSGGDLIALFRLLADLKLL